QLAAEALAHVRRGQAALRQLLLERGRGDVLLRIGEGGVQLARRDVELQRAGLRDQQVLHDQIVEETELRRHVLFEGGRRRRRLTRAAVGLLDILASDLAAIDDRPRIGGGLLRRAGGGVRPARQRGNRRGRRGHEYEQAAEAATGSAHD